MIRSKEIFFETRQLELKQEQEKQKHYERIKAEGGYCTYC